MKVDKVISDNQVVVFVVSKAKYQAKIVQIAAAAAKKKVSFVSLNKPYTVLGESFKKKKIDLKNVVFVDTVSGDLSKEKGYAVIHVSSPRALTEVSIAMTKAAKKTDVTVFDSLSTLLVYSDNATAIKFVHSAVSKVRKTKKKFVFVSLSDDSKTALMNDVSMFVDKVVKI